MVIVNVSVVASVVIEIPLPATNVNVSVEESATTLDCPLTAIVAKELLLPPPPPPPAINNAVFELDHF